MKEGWEIKKFVQVFDLQMGKTPSRDNSDYWGGDNLWVAIADLKDNKYISSTKEQITDSAVRESGIKKVKAGTVIMSFKLSVGKAAIAQQDLYTNEAIMAFNVLAGYQIKAEYIYYYLKGYKWKGANKAVMGMTLNKKSISENLFAFPPLSEQQRIVSELDCISGIIEKKKQQLTELDNLAQAIFYDMFGDPIQNEKGWEVKKLGEVCEISDYVANGSFASLKENVKYNDKEDYAVLIRMVDNSNGFDPSQFVYVDEHSYQFLEKSRLFGGEIIMNNVGARLATSFLCPYLEKPMTLGPNSIVIKTSCNIFFQFMFMLPSSIATIRSISGHTAMPKFNKTDFKKLLFPLPPLPLQQSFAAKIAAIEEQKALIRRSIAETEALFGQRMDYYFN